MRTTSLRFVAFSAACVLALQALVLFLLGQPPICECGYVKLWEGVVLGSGNSQHVTDWYTFSHVIHGFLFYLLLWLALPRVAHGKRLVAALALEAGWEIFENTPWVIDRYREQALAQGYVGDSVLNSVCDSIAAAVGFVLAWKLPVRVTVAAAVALELFVGWSIRDNLTLNVLNFLWPLEAVRTWQAGGG